MRFDHTRYVDLVPLRRAAVVDAFRASTTIPPDRAVCLKFFRAERYQVTPELEERFLATVLSASGPSSPSVLTPIDYGLSPEGPVFVVPWLEGTSLRRVLDEFHAHGEPFPVTLAAYVADEVLRILAEHALARTNAGVRPAVAGHGAITPAAIRIHTSGRVFLTEPAMWHVLGAQADAARVACGADAYRPHDALECVPDPRIDVYAVAAVLHRLLGAHSSDALAPFFERTLCAAERRIDSFDEARELLQRTHAFAPHRDSCRAWLAERAEAHARSAANARSSAASGPHASARASSVPPESSPRDAHAHTTRPSASGTAPLRRPRAHEGDAARVVVAEGGGLWKPFVVGLVLGFAGAVAYAVRAML